MHLSHMRIEESTSTYYYCKHFRKLKLANAIYLNKLVSLYLSDGHSSGLSLLNERRDPGILKWWLNVLSGLLHPMLPSKHMWSALVPNFMWCLIFVWINNQIENGQRRPLVLFQNTCDVYWGFYLVQCLLPNIIWIIQVENSLLPNISMNNPGREQPT